MKAVTGPTIVIAKSRPHEKLLLAYSAILGGLQLVHADRPGVIEATLPRWGSAIWDALMLLSGVIGLFGMHWRKNRLGGLRIEQSAMWIGAGPLMFYAVVIVVRLGVGMASIVGAGIVLAWGLANIARAVSIGLDLKSPDRR